MPALLVWFAQAVMRVSQWGLAALFAAAAFSTVALGQETPAAIPAVTPLITHTVDETQLTRLTGNTHPLARPEFDLGTAPATLPMERMLLVLKRSPDQEAALRKLLDDQQDKNSPHYHRWLTPEEFGRQFGPTDADMQTITSWLQSHGFQVGSSKGRTVLEFSGSASQVQEAFHTTIHKYIVNGEQHWANSSDPSIPTAVTPAVAGVLTLHNFIKQPALHWNSQPFAAKLIPGKKPQVTFPAQNGQPVTNALAPSDYATIYNINPVYLANNYGSASIAVVGRSNLYNSGQDIQNFRNIFLALYPVNNFQVVTNGPDPGDLGGGEEAEATLDSTWSGALAPNATVQLVVSATTNTTDGIDLSEAYIVETNLSDVMTESFSSCELYATDAQLAGASALAEQAAAQGITYIVSTGDDGAAGCDDPSVAPASHPVSVNFLASTAFNVAVGGTMFNENGNATKYWTSAAPFDETAISYIPEDVWNESSSTNGLWSGSGGASAGNIAAGGSTPGVPKPFWQSGVAGIPGDGVRDLPDVSLTAASHDPYLLCLEGSCLPNSQGFVSVYFVGGTSAAAPSFAGIMALVDDSAGRTNTQLARQGMPGYILYRLAATQSTYPSQCNASNTTTAPASACIFNDVTIGNNTVPGEAGTQYQAEAGYDLTTGLGSVNVANLVNQWGTVTFNPTTTVLTLNGGSAVTITHGQSVPLNVTVSSSSGLGPAPTGDVVLLTGNGVAPSTMDLFHLNGGQANSSTSDLPGGGNSSYNVWARYGGDSTYASSNSASVTVSVTPEPSTTTLSVLTVNQNGQPIPFTGGPFGSFVYVRADVAGKSGHGVPTGSVTFTDSFGTIPGGAIFGLNSQGNTANANGVNFDAGTHTVSASYGGDPSFNPSSTTQSQTFTITPGFYANIASAQSTVQISAPGGSGSSSVSISNSTGFSGTISLACSGLPSEAQCIFSPTSVAANGTPNTTNVAITITTTATTAMNHSQPHRYFAALWMLSLGLVLSGVFLGGKDHRTRGLLMFLTLLMLLSVPACGGSGGSGGGNGNQNPPPNPGTPKGTSNVIVTATSGSITSTTGFVLMIQ